MVDGPKDEGSDVFRRDGYLAPIPVLDADEVAAALGAVERLESESGGRLRARHHHKLHLLLPDLDHIVHHPRVLDAVAQVLGPDLLCWTSDIFIKAPSAPAFVSWHQDSTYWGLSSPDVVTAWVALTPSTDWNGALRVIPGTHELDQVPHEDTHAPDNLLSRGQEIAVAVDESLAMSLVLKPGEMSLHHVRLVHGSPPNRSTRRRVGIAIRYIPTTVRQLGGDASAGLVRGLDEHHHFLEEPRPTADLEDSQVAFHADALRRMGAIVSPGT